MGSLADLGGGGRVVFPLKQWTELGTEVFLAGMGGNGHQDRKESGRCLHALQ